MVNEKGDETLARSLTLAYLTHTSIIPIFNRVRMPTRTCTVVGVLTIFGGGDGRKSKRCNDYNQHNGRRERELG